jgi:microcompartment protein CcmL/EutN
MLTENEETLHTQLAKFEVLLTVATGDIQATKAAAENAVEMVDRRLAHVELNVRALEDWRLSQKVLEAERTKRASEATKEAVQVAEQAAEDRREWRRQHVSVKQFWTGIAITSTSMLVAALISSGTI